MWRAVDGAGRDVASNATTSALVAVAVLLSMAGVGAALVARHRTTPHGAIAWFAAFGSLGGCIALTLFREGLRAGWRPAGLVAWTTTGWERLATTDLIGSSQYLLNVALFVPAGVAWMWVTGRPLPTLGGLVGLTMLLESVQGLTGVGGADITDVAANSTGAALGVGAGVVVTAAMSRLGPVDGSDRVPRRRAATTAVLVGVVVISLAALLVGADRRRAHLHDQLESVFAGTTYGDINRVVRPDVDDAEVEPNARFTDFQQLLDAVSVRPDGFRYTDDRIEIRWPALFFGFRRCVFVSWTPSGLDISDASGRTCTEFIG